MLKTALGKIDEAHAACQAKNHDVFRVRLQKVLFFEENWPQSRGRTNIPRDMTYRQYPVDLSIVSLVKTNFSSSFEDTLIVHQTAVMTG